MREGLSMTIPMHWIRDHTITGLAASVTSVSPQELGETTGLTMSVTTGSDMAVTVNWGDGNSDSLSATDGDQLLSLSPTHVYSTAGSYTITVTVTNDRNTVSVTTANHEVDASIQNPTYVLEHAEMGSYTSDYFTATAGTRMTVNWDFGDGNTESTYYADINSLPSESSPHQYSGYPSTLALYTVTVTISNLVSSYSFEVEAAVSQRIRNLEVFKTGPVSTSDPTVTFTQNLTSGKHMTCGRYFGDDVLFLQYDENPELGITYTHTYAAVGATYEFTLECYNYLNYLVFYTQLVHVLHPISNGGFDDNDIQTHAWKNVIYEDAVSVGFYLNEGTNATCTVLLDGSDDTSSLTYTMVENGGSSGTYSKSGSNLALGQHTVQISCSNSINSYDFHSFILNYQKTIQGLTVSPHATHLQPGENFQLSANTNEGSHISYTWQLGDGSGDQITTMTSVEGSYQEVLEYSYINPGYFTVTVFASNNVSSNIEATTNTAAEWPVEDISLSVVDVTRPSESVVFTVTHPGSGYNNPTSTHSYWDFDNDGGEPDMDEDMVLADGTPYLCSETFTNYGDFTVSLTIRNNVSEVTLTQAYRVGVGITGFQCESVTPYTIEMNVETEFNWHVNQGSDLLYRAYFEDGQYISPVGRTITNDWTVSDDTRIPTTYATAGVHTAHLSVENIFGHDNCTVNIFVHEPVQGLTCHSVQNYLEPTQDFTIFGNTTHGSKVHYEFECGDGSAITTLTMDQTTGAHQQQSSCAYTSPGYYHFHVSAISNVSDLSQSCSVGVEYPVPNNIVLNIQNVTRPGESVVFTVTHPGSGYNNPTSTHSYWDFDNDGGDPDMNQDMVLADGTPYLCSETFTNYGDFTVSVTIRNNVSEVTLTKAYRVGVGITGFECESVTPYTIEMNVETEFNWHVNQGSDLFYRAYFEDGQYISPVGRTITNDWTVSDDRRIPTTYGTAGVHTAHLSVENIFGHDNCTVNIFVHEPVQGLTCHSVQNYLEPTQDFTIFGNTTHGSKVHYEFDCGDGSAITTLTMDQTTGAHQQQSSCAYTSPGYYHFHVSAISNVSDLSQSCSVGVEYPVPNNIVLNIQNVTRPGENVVFTVTHPGSGYNNPTSTHSYLDFDNDGGEPDMDQDMVLADGTPYLCSETFTNYGDFTVSVTIRNNVSEVTLTKAYRVGVGITGFECESVTPYTIEMNVETEFNWHVNQGSDLFYRAYFEDGQYISPVGRTITNDWTLSDDRRIATTYTTAGIHTAHLSVENIFGHDNCTVNIFVHEPVQGLTCHSVQNYLEPTQDFTIFGNTTHGSKLIYEFDCGDGSVTTTLSMDETTGTYQQPSTCAYTIPNYYYFQVTARNNVSQQSQSCFVGVEYPVPNGIVLNIQNVTRPAEAVVLTVVHPGAAFFDPDSTRAKWDFRTDASFDREDDILLADGINYEISELFPEYGDFLATVTVFNNVSSVNVSLPYRIGVAISGLLCISVSPYTISTNVPTSFNWHVNAGSVLKYNGCFGDGNCVAGPGVDRTATGDWASFDDTIIFNTYAVAGYYTANFSASNIFGYQNCSVDIFVHEPVANLTYIALIQYLEPLDVFVLYANITNGSKVTFEFDCDDGLGTTIEIMDQTTGTYEQMTTCSYPDPNYHWPNVIVINNISSYTESYFIGIEYPVPADIYLTAVNTTRPTEPILFTIHQPLPPTPTSVIASWDYLYYNITDYVEQSALSDVNPHEHWHEYPDYGDFFCQVCVSNNLSEQCTIVEFRVGVKLEGFDVIELDSSYEAGVETTFRGQLSRGSTVNYEVVWDFDYPDVKEYFERYQNINWNGTDITLLNHTYLEAKRDVKIVITPVNNTFTTDETSNYIAQIFYIRVDQQVSANALNCTHRYAKVDEVITFFVITSDGSSVSSYVIYGDGENSSAVLHQRFFASELETEFTHTYSHSGNYTAIAASTNVRSPIITSHGIHFIGSVTETADKVIVQQLVTSIDLTSNDTIIAVPSGTVILYVSDIGPLADNGEPPTDLFCNWTFPDATTSQTFAGNLTTVHEHSHTFPEDFVGTHTIYVNCSNYISYATAEVTIVFQQTIEQVLIYPGDIIVRSGSPVTFSVNCEKGSHVYYEVDYYRSLDPDGARKEIHMSNAILDGSVQNNFTHIFSNAGTDRPFRGNITINILLFNNKSSVLVTQDVIIQVPLTAESITGIVRDPVKYPDGSMQFILMSVSENENYPDDVFFRWDYLCNNETDEVVDFLTTEQIHEGGDILIRPNTFDYVGEKHITTCVNASNLVSSINITIGVVLLRAIENYYLSILDDVYNGATEKGVQRYINATIQFGTDVEYTLNQGDGMPVQTFETSGDGINHTFAVTYDTIGNYTLNGTIQNLVSNNNSNNIVIYVQNKVEEILLTCKQYILLDRLSGSYNYSLNLTHGELEPTTVHGRFVPDTTGGSVLETHNLYVSRWPYEATFEYIYSADINTNPNVSVHLWNRLSNMTVNCNPQIQEVLHGLDVYLQSKIVEIRESVNLTTTLRYGTYYVLTVTYGDGLSHTGGIFEFDNRIALNHTFIYPGVYQIEVYAENNISTINESINIWVFNPVPEYVIASNSTASLSEGTNFKLILQKTNISAPNPTNATIEIDWGDSTGKINMSLDDVNDTHLCHTYQETGFYTVRVNISNPINKISLAHNVIAEVEIRDLVIHVSDATGRIYGSSDPVIIGLPVILQATISQGTNYQALNLTKYWKIDYSGMIGASTRVNTTDYVFHTFMQTGEHILEVAMSNALGGQTAYRSLTVIEDISIIDFSYNETSIINKTVVFSIQTAEDAEEICFEIILNSTIAGSVTLWLGPSREICENNNDAFAEDLYKETAVGKLFTYSYIFTIEDTYSVHLRIITQYTSGSPTPGSSDIIVQGQPCFSPIITLLDDLLGLTPGNPINYLKQYEISAPRSGYNVAKRCEATSHVNTVWSVHRVLRTGELIDFDFTSTDHPAEIQLDRMVFPAMLMPYGLYLFTVNISMVGHTEQQDALDFYVNIESSELITSLADSVRVGGEFKLSLDVEEDTYDPDALSKEGLVYEWFCGKIASVEDAYDDGITADYVRDYYDQIPVVSIPTASESDLKTFCNGTRAGRLDIHSSNLTFYTSHMKSNRNYRLILRVSKDVRVAIREMELEIVPGNPPQSEFRCFDPNPNDYINFCSWNVISFVYDYYFTVRCTSCFAAQRYNIFVAIEILSYAGKRKRRSLASNILESIEDTLQSDGSHLFKIPSGVLPPGTSFKLLFTVEVEGLQDGLFSVILQANGLPHSGLFSIDPMEAYAIATDVNFQQSGWQAYVPDLTVTLQYTYEICLDYTANPPADCTNKSTTTTQFSKEGLASNGNKTGVRLYIKDDYGTSIITDFVEVLVHPQPPGAAEEKLNNINEVSNSNIKLTSRFLLPDINQSTHLGFSPLQTGLYQNPVAFMDLLGTLAGSLSTPVEVTTTPTTDTSSGSNSGGGNYAEQTAAQEAAAALAAAAAAAQRRREQAMLSTMISSMVAFATSTDDEAPPMTSEQIMMSIATTASLAKKMDKTQSDDAKSGSLNIMTAMAGSFATLPVDEQQTAASGLFSVAGSVLGTLATDQETEIPVPVDLDIIPDEAAEEEAARLAAEAAERQQQAGLSAVSAVQNTVNSIIINIRGSLEEGVPLVIGDETMQVSIQKSTADDLAGTEFTSIAGSVQLPGNLTSGDDGGSLFFQMMVMESNVYSWDESAAAVSTGVTQMSLTNEDGDDVEMDNLEENPLIVAHETPEGESNMADLSNISRDSVSNLVYFYIPITVNNSAYVACFIPQDTNIRFGLYFKFNVTETSLDKPNKTEGESDFSVVQQEHVEAFCIVVPQNYIFYPGFFVGLDVFLVDEEVELIQNDTIPPFDMNSIITRCRAWDDGQMKWVTDKCKVGGRSTTAKTECECRELSPTVNTFAGGVTLPKVNTIDFANVFGNFASLLAANPTVFAVILGILLLYALIGMWARYRDKKDVEKWGVFPLVGNKKSQDVFYKISVFTGMRQNAGTKSKVCFILSGDKGDTGIRIADDGRGKHYTRGSVRHFVMSTDFDIGTPTFLRIWHDNSGESSDAGWFLDKVAVENLNSKKRWFFFCSRWLAAEEDDGQVDRMIPLAGSDELENFNKLFFSKTRKNLTDDHLWVSILSRPTKSSFTRLQRLTCCISLLFTTMIVNAMFFRDATETEDSANDADTRVQIGPIILSVNTLLVSIFGSLIIVPPNLIIVQFFRKSKPKNWKQEDEDELTEIKEKTKGKNKETNKDENGEEAPKQKKQRIWKLKYPLPHFCIYIAWTIAVLSIAVPAFFVILYSLDWGQTKSLEWMSSLVLSFAQSVVFVQPLKIVVMAAAISLLFKTFDELDDEKENKETNAKPLTDEKLEDKNKMIQLTQAPIAYIPQPPSKTNLERARKNRAFEKKMWDIIKEVIFYFAFLVLISFIAWGNKDDVVFKMNTHVKNIVNYGEGAKLIKGDEVLTGHEYWEWLNETAIPSIFYDTDYAGNPTTSRSRGFMADMTSFRVGAVRLRQSRVMPGSCEIPKAVAGIIMECNDKYTSSSEESRNFSIGWYNAGNSSYIPADSITRLQKSFIYYSMFDLKGLPYWAWMGTYGGGGYVAELGTSSYQSHKLINELIEDSWIDFYTRAVFLEFTIYNPNINLFAYVNYLMEFPASGGVIPSERVTSFQVYSAVGGMGSGVVAAQLIYCVVFIYFLVREILKFKNQRRAYWKEPWNYIELGILVGSVVAISMYVLREKFGRIIMNQLKDNKEGYTNYSTLAIYNENIDYVIGFLVFLANLKFLKLLRFNKHVCELSTTFRHAGKDLMYFFLTLFIIMMAFGIWGMVIFGKRLYTFSTFVYTCETMLSMLIGKFNLADMDMADRYLGKPYFVLFTLVVFFVLVNMFLGILTIAYDEVRAMPVSPVADHKVIGFLFKKIKRFFKIQVKSDEHGDGYMEDTDVINMRLTAIDQHVTHLYNESVRIKQIEQEQVKTESKEKSKKTLWKATKMLAFKKPSMYKPNAGSGGKTNLAGITSLAFKKPATYTPTDSPSDGKPNLTKMAMAFKKKPAVYPNEETDVTEKPKEKSKLGKLAMAFRKPTMDKPFNESTIEEPLANANEIPDVNEEIPQVRDEVKQKPKFAKLAMAFSKPAK